MDPLSIATAAGSAISVLYTLADTLYTFVQDAKAIDTTLGVLRSDVKSLAVILESIKSLGSTSHDNLSFGEDSDFKRLWQAILAVIQDCSDTTISIQKDLGAIIGRNPSGSLVARSIRQVRFQRRKADIDQAHLRMEAHKSNLQLGLQTLNILASRVSSSRITENVAEKFEELSRLLRETKLSSEERTPKSSLKGPRDIEFERHSSQLQASTINVIIKSMKIRLPDYSGQSPSSDIGSEKKEDHDYGTEIDLVDESDDELEAQLTKNLLIIGIELSVQYKYAEAESTLQNSLKEAQRVSTHRIDIEQLKEAQFQLAIAYLYQEKWEAAEEILAYLTTEPVLSPEDLVRKLDALYYLAQVYLARHQFDCALISCKEARTGQKRSSSQSLLRTSILLVLIYETSGDRVAAALYAQTFPEQPVYDEKDIAVLRFTSHGHGLSIDEEISAQKILANKNPYGPNYPDSKTGLALRWAAGVGYTDVVSLLLWRGVDIESSSVDGITPLMSAARGGHESTIIVLLEKGADINRQANTGDSALKKAAGEGHMSTVRLLLDRGAKIDGDAEDLWLPLSLAAVQGHEGIARLLVERGAAVNAVNTSHRTALMYAAREGHDRIVALLIDAGANLHLQDRQGRNALKFAEDGAKTTVVKLLEKASVNG